jgi:hypothetical protein
MDQVVVREVGNPIELRGTSNYSILSSLRGKPSVGAGL